MSIQQRFDRVKVLIAEPDKNNRDNIDTVIRNAGFRQIDHVRSWEDARTSIRLGSPDILILATEFPGEPDPCDVVHALRHHEYGGNPFIPIIMMTSAPEERVVRRIVNSGADDLFVMPLSSGHVIDRISALIKSRKPFVVTTDYIGPDRRSPEAKRGGIEIPLINVPNTLRARIVGGSEQSMLQQEIDDTIKRINQEKLERHAVQIGLLVELIVPAYERRIIDQNIRDYVDRLVFVAEDTSRRLLGTSYNHVSELCGSLLDVATRIKSAEFPEEKDVKLLKPLSQAIGKAFDIKDDVAAIAHKISERIRSKKGQEVSS
ncbi:MAG: response regulator [Rhodospirillales bacterium]|nr:response regulator [Rhodospirillales bacterium]MCW9003347.1 response regulator [Rhodospirillales bacterium]